MRMLVPIPVLLAHPTFDTPGDAIRWSRGQKATLLGEQSGARRPVTILTGEFVGHEAVPGKLCIEVSFDEEGGFGCVLASSLRLR